MHTSFSVKRVYICVKLTIICSLRRILVFHVSNKSTSTTEFDSSCHPDFLPFFFFCLVFLPIPVFHGFLSCISGYSPYASFPSKALAANLVSDLSSSSPLDLGNCFHYIWQAVLLTAPSLVPTECIVQDSWSMSHLQAHSWTCSRPLV